MNEVVKVEQFGTVSFNGIEFPVHGTKEEPLFDATFVAKLIGGESARGSDYARMVSDDEKFTTQIMRSDGKPVKKTFLTEDGLYEVLFQSRKPVAKEFKKVVKAYLKDIRLNGGVNIWNDSQIKALAACETQEALERTYELIDVANKRMQESVERFKEMQSQCIVEKQARLIETQKRLAVEKAVTCSSANSVGSIIRELEPCYDCAIDVKTRELLEKKGCICRRTYDVRAGWGHLFMYKNCYVKGRDGSLELSRFPELCYQPDKRDEVKSLIVKLLDKAGIHKKTFFGEEVEGVFYHV